MEYLSIYLSYGLYQRKFPETAFQITSIFGF